MYGQGHLSVPLVVTIAAAIVLYWFVFGNLIKKKKRSSQTPIVNNNPAASTSASASAATLVGEYEVFLSFRGADTRNGFTDHLYHNLVGAGVCTFRDDNELRVGEEIGPELLRAIKQSKISIPIFSKNYAYSKWCLREFAQMMECRKNGEQIIYPIFYDVEPSEVQHYERGSYKAAFLRHDKDKKLDEETVQQWKTALKIVGDLKGPELEKMTNGSEGELVKIVVDDVLSKLKKSYQHVPENLVGMDSHREEMERLLNIDSSGVRIIGILGMGGLGKTTIAKVIYNQMCELFERHCFLENVRENSNSNIAIVKLQKQLVSKILKRESKFDDVSVGIDKIKGAIRGKKVLIVLDDVDNMSQIEKLIGDHSWYEAGSRIIITTRNEEVLLALKMTCQNDALHELYECYRPNLMLDDPALQLFSKCAFKEDSPPDGYDDLAREVIRNAGGLPLVLVTLGSLLYLEKDKVSWGKKLEKLKAMPPEEVLGRLRISFDALDDAQKEIFLDIACLFSEVDKTNPFYMWEDCGFYPWEGINTLVRRCLITVGRDNKLWMHDQLKELGKQIICEKNRNEPGNWSRLWRSKDATNIVKTNLGTKKVKVVCLQALGASDCEEDYFDDDSEIPRLRLVGRNFRKLLNLRYLRMDLIDLDGDFKNLLQNLRWLQWRGCSGNYAPTNFNLENLLVLDLTLGRMEDDWGGWSQIKVSNKLKVLHLETCYYFSRVPHLSAFPALERLELPHCKSLCRLDGLEELKSLKYLNTTFCCALESLLDLSKLTKLQELNVSFCKTLTAIQGLDKLESLEILNTVFCTALGRLPDLSNLEKLTIFKSSWCKKLDEIEGLDRLASLEHLEITGCKSLKRLPDLSNLKKLKKLKVGKLKLTEFQGLGGLESLEHLDMHKCKSIKNLPDFSNLTNLKELDVSYCVKLTEIRGLEELKFLRRLCIVGCEPLENWTYNLPNTKIQSNAKDADGDNSDGDSHGALMSRRWRTFKYYKTQWIYKLKRNPRRLQYPPPKYAKYIQQSVWEEFVKQILSGMFQELSMEQSERRSMHIYNHRLSKKGYAGLTEEIKAEKGPSYKIDRSMKWTKAREKKGGGYDEPTQKMVDKMDTLRKEAQDGSLVTEGSKDILTLALGTPEHSGRMRGLGFGVTPTIYFDHPRRGSRRNANALEAELQEEKKKRIELEAELMEFRAQQLSKKVASNTQKSDQRNYLNHALGRQVFNGKKSQTFDSKLEGENDDDDVDMEDYEKYTCESPMIEAFTNTLKSLENAIEIPMDKKMFEEENDRCFIVKDALVDFCKMNPIDVTCIVAYMRHLYDKFERSRQIFKFFNSASFNAASGHAMSQLIQQRLKSSKRNQICYIPFNIQSKFHWVLIVIDLSNSVVYWLDSKQSKPSEQFKLFFNTGINASHIEGKRMSATTWVTPKCPRQKGDVECGYYVMKFMKELLEESSSHTIQAKVRKLAEKETYTMEELNEVRVEFIKFIEQYINNDSEYK